MPRSKRYRQLLRNLSELRRYLLPAHFDPTGSYSDRVLTRTLGYRVLVHAEIEAFLEDRAWNIALNALRAWKDRQEVTRTAMSLIAFCGLLQDSPPKSLEADQPNEVKQWAEKLDLDRKLKRAANAFHHVVQRNHGIREENLLGLLLPVGVPADQIDPFWVATLDSFGERRGEAAHSSVVGYRTRQPPDPEGEYREVQGIAGWLKTVDAHLSALE